MSIDNENLKKYVRGENCNEKLLYETLNELVILVIYRHYAKHIEDTELVSLGVYKSITLLKSPHADISKNLSSFVYTGVRNEIGNYIKKERKFLFREVSIFDEGENETSVTGEYSALESMNKHLGKIKTNFKELGIFLSLDIWRVANGHGKKPKGYERFALEAAFLWEFSG